MLILGAHMSISKGFLKAVQKTVEDYNTNALQVFLKSPRSLTFCKLSEEDANLTKDYINKNNVFLVGHCSYLLNFAKIQEYRKEDIFHAVPNLESNESGINKENFKEKIEESTKKLGNWAVNSLLDDLVSIYKMGGFGVVLHTGRYTDETKEDGINNIVKNLKSAIQNINLKINNSKTPYIILENTAGQGTEIGNTLEELSTIYNMLEKDKRIKICIDLAHAYSAGYDFATKQGFDRFIEKFENLFGIENLGLFHFNDSKKGLGANLDRHESIGCGTLKDEALRYISDFAIKNTIPLILETPGEPITHLQDIDRIKGWYNK